METAVAEKKISIDLPLTEEQEYHRSTQSIVEERLALALQKAITEGDGLFDLQKTLNSIDVSDLWPDRPEPGTLLKCNRCECTFAVEDMVPVNQLAVQFDRTQNAIVGVELVRKGQISRGCLEEIRRAKN